MKWRPQTITYDFNETFFVLKKILIKKFKMCKYIIYSFNVFKNVQRENYAHLTSKKYSSVKNYANFDRWMLVVITGYDMR